MRLTIAICCMINLHLTSYRVSAGYSDMVLNGPLPKLEDYSDGGDGSGSNKDQKSEYGDGRNGQQGGSVTNDHGEFRGQRDVQERGSSRVQQKKAKIAGTEGQVVFGRKRHGRFEFEDGERYEESGDSGDGRELNWYSGKGDRSDNGEGDDHGEHPPAENQQHRGNNYTHRRRKNYTQLQRNQKVVGNKVNIGDLSRFRKIHKKHFGGDNGNTEKAATGNGRINHNCFLTIEQYIK